ncbi:hypothetical protein Veis_2659 [Verminephrobacter eiseniae EF01-2]|uniref:Thioredoxin domain-containing protein n=1 Tax=Verminephrobacter eiseniae (strain EF01-2) TaxID=391735 RepID=A1WL95_VEREI|nr:thioredoxin domain-containing protein [Verminephrobacter eiseniae]ABM58402.1 hypothetical protein Veis_2659 [Verminephrobacter eiseniae EF01-2]
MQPDAPNAAADPWWAICLCPDWCGACRDYRSSFDALARAHPGVRFEWVDIEDEADIAGDLEFETFPTLLIGHRRRALFLGPLLPRAPVLERLLGSLQAAHQGADQGGHGPTQAGAQAQELFDRVRAARRG